MDISSNHIDISSNHISSEEIHHYTIIYNKVNDLVNSILVKLNSR